MDPLTIALIAGGVKTLGGLAQTAFSGQKRAEKDLSKQIQAIPEYVKSPSILEYYEQARQRYGVSPTQTAMYKRQMQNIQRAGATGLAGAQGARGRMGAASTIARSLSDATLGAEVAAEAEQNRRFGQLGAAAQMRRGEDVMQQQRELMKQEQKIRQAAAKAAGRAAVQRAGLTNIFGGLTDVGKAALTKPS
jgi:small-conductance mechanosensitive channel